MKRMLAITASILGALLVAGVLWSRVQPSITGEWAPDHSELPHAQIDGDRVTISGFRNFTYRSAEDFDVVYEERSYDLNDLESVWYVVTPFGGGGGAAHTFLSFGFGDSTFVSVSVEARRQPGEGYSLWAGMMKRYELIYVLGDERDLIGLRAKHRGNRVLAYPIRTERAKIRAVFESILRRVNELRDQPEFYNTLTNNCTTAILRHVNEVADEPIGYGLKVLLPARSDRLAYDRGLIETDLPFEEARVRYDITERAKAVGPDDDFSVAIRRIPPATP